VRRFRLRYRSTDLELPEGAFVIGRSSECHLALDDARVSRQHARLLVGATSVVVEDLGSRNGVYVDGRRIDAPESLKHLSRVTIGDQNLTLVDLEQERSHTIEAVAVHCARCGAPNARGADRCARCGAAMPGARRAAAQTVEFTSPLVDDRSNGASTSAFKVVSSLAEKALAMGKHDDAERLLRPQLESILESAKSTGTIDEDLFTAASGFALRLVGSGQAAQWIDWLFALHASTSRLMSIELIDALHENVRKAGYSNTKSAQTYVDSLASAAQEYGPAERFRLRRLEGLVRVLRG
jgi:predicted component of type VI protein secretion system